jgi:hypothetical protein
MRVLKHTTVPAPDRTWVWLLMILMVIGLVTSFAPIEKTLGERVRLVYFHGAWVWTGKAAFAAAGLAGLMGLIRRRATWQQASLALGRTGLVFWLTYLPLSLLVQQLNWGGIFWDEPRWRIPLAFGIAGALLQAGLAMMDDLRLTSLANLGFGAALWYFLGSIENVLHPDSPIFSSGSVRIQVFFSALLLLSIVFGGLLAWFFYHLSRKRAQPG